MADDLLTCHEAADIIGITDARVRQLIRDGALPGIRKGRFWLVRRRDVELFARLPRGIPGKPRRLST